MLSNKFGAPKFEGTAEKELSKRVYVAVETSTKVTGNKITVPSARTREDDSKQQRILTPGRFFSYEAEPNVTFIMIGGWKLIQAESLSREWLSSARSLELNSQPGCLCNVRLDVKRNIYFT